MSCTCHELRTWTIAAAQMRRGNMLLFGHFDTELSPVSTRVLPAGPAGVCLLPHSSALPPAEKNH